MNDYEHVINTHEQHLEEINNQIKDCEEYGPCENSQCHLFRRFHDEEERKASNNRKDHKSHFYCDIFDSIHNWLMHMYETGMRIKKSVIDKDDDTLQNSDEKGKDQQANIDKHFAKISNHVRNKREKLRIRSDRFRDDDKGNNKFKLKVTNKQSATDQQCEEGNTFIDIMLEEIEKAKLEIQVRDKLIAFIKQELFDTDALNEDLVDSKKGSNIIQATANATKFHAFISDYIAEHNRMCIFVY